MEGVISFSYPRSLLHFPSAFSKSQLHFSLKEITDGSPVFAYQRNLQQSSIFSCKRRGRSLKHEYKKIPHSFNIEESSSSNQEEIIALFRRIKSSISKTETASSKTRSSNGESVFDVLLESRNRATERNYEKEAEVMDPMLTRPPSSFMKRSPIRSPARVNGKVAPETIEVSTSTVGIEEMKVGELKEVAKSRGIKGYSKLKKSELLELLKA